MFASGSVRKLSHGKRPGKSLREGPDETRLFSDRVIDRDCRRRERVQRGGPWRLGFLPARGITEWLAIADSFRRQDGNCSDCLRRPSSHGDLPDAAGTGCLSGVPPALDGPLGRDAGSRAQALNYALRRHRVLTRRKPMLLLRLPGELLLRFADRTFLALLFQLPPRFTRFEPDLAVTPSPC